MMIKRKEQHHDTSIINARILYYDFFAGLFLYDLLSHRKDLLLKQIAILKQEPIDEGDIVAFNILENEILQNGVTNLIDEYTAFFMLPFNPNVNLDIKSKKRKRLPNPQIILYLSYYIDKTIAGSGLVIAKEKIRKSKIRLNEQSFKENEEHFGFLLLFVRYLLQNGEFSLVREVFADCINPMKNGIIADMKNRNGDSIYSHICTILEHFLMFESAINRV